MGSNEEERSSEIYRIEIVYQELSASKVDYLYTVQEFEFHSDHYTDSVIELK